MEDPDPTKWKKVAHVEDPLWGGKYPNPFHMVFSIDSSKLYLSILHPSPAASGVMVVDTATWTIKKEIQGIGPDLQTPAITYDGKYMWRRSAAFSACPAASPSSIPRRMNWSASYRALAGIMTASSFRPSSST